tara:strand:- start:3495 stop:4508 length:1014 start_codon:yes stop_codon:yes gene_type:complete
VDIKNATFQQHQGTSHVYDLGELDALRREALTQDKAALHKVAQRFEAIFLSMMLKGMRDANQYFEEDNPLNTRYTKFYRDMHDEQVVQDLSQKGVLGLADLIVQQLAPDYKNYKPASVLEGEKIFQKSRAGLPHEAQPMSVKSNVQEQPIEEISDIALAKMALNSTEQQAQGDASTSERGALFEHAQDFIDQLLPHAQNAAQQLQVQPQVLLAQSALETGWGRHVLQRANGTSSLNLFNIKADDRWQGDKVKVNTLEFKQGAMRQEAAFFRAYDSIAESFQDYVDMLMHQPHYQQALQAAHQPQAFLAGLQQAGYATDPNYQKKVMQVMAQILDKMN